MKINKSLLILIFLIIIITHINFVSSAVYQVNISIQSEGVITTNYNVVGDFFHYNISILENNSKPINDNFEITILSPDNKSLALGKIEYLYSDNNIETKEYPIYEKVNSTESHINLVHYLNESDKNKISIWPFEKAGDYTLRLCSSNFSSEFIHFYGSEGRYYFYPHCINYYFSVMPQWQNQRYGQEDLINKQNQDKNDNLLNLTKILVNLTNWIIGLTIILVIFSFIQIISIKDTRKGFKIFIFSVPSLILGAFSIFLFMLLGTIYPAPPIYWYLLPLLFSIMSIKYLVDLKKIIKNSNKPES